MDQYVVQIGLLTMMTLALCAVTKRLFMPSAGSVGVRHNTLVWHGPVSGTDLSRTPGRVTQAQRVW